MVKDTRAAKRPGDLRALNQPEPAAVKTEDGGLPGAIRVRGRWLPVQSVVDRWRVDDEWWRDHPVSRMYYECLGDAGLQVTVFQDLLTGHWYHQRS